MATAYARNPKIEQAPMRNETVLFNPENNKFCLLNHTAAFLWQQLSESRTVEQLAAELCKSFADVSSINAVQDVEEAMRHFQAVECIVNSQA
jgi:hypothetical protein